ncbi:hypothetical protein ACFRJ9_00450 [Paenarthrobacter sp. NPDC056912]|uniref:hypothetical protein n=1 Tax=Paenarthrobacter sp. NPDC056912 TaxID=3345965 RepID=UPI0036700A74
MTCRDSEREAIVDELLLDADLLSAPDVRQTLLSLGSYAHMTAPAPNAELAAMLAGPHDEVTKRRWRHKHRTAVVSVAVVAAMGLGVSGVAAASSGFTRTPTFIDELLGNFAPQWSAAPPVLPAPDAPKISTEPAPVVDPAAVPPTAQPLASEEATTPVLPGAPAQDSAPAAAPDAGKAPATGNGPDAGKSPAAGNGPDAAPQAVVVPPAAAPNGASNGAAQGKPANPTPERPATVKPKPEPTAPAADSKPGADIKKPGQTFPSLAEKKSEKELQSFLDRLKQWMKRGDR